MEKRIAFSISYGFGWLIGAFISSQIGLTDGVDFKPVVAAIMATLWAAYAMPDKHQ